MDVDCGNNGQIDSKERTSPDVEQKQAEAHDVERWPYAGVEPADSALFESDV